MAFNAIAPPSAASTSSSSKPFYDVFINHRGKDVKHKLASIIYNMFDLKGVQAFFDKEELDVGDSFPQAIEEAMRSASVHIAIFSSSYAESPWCLEELSLMLQLNVTIIPVFYGVDPSDLRYVEKGKYAVAFAQHRTKRRYNLEKIKEWKDALSRVSYLSGCILHDMCDEGKLLKEIVETALSKIKKVPLEVATFPVGLEKAVQDFESKVGSVSENVHIVGIVGMGGSGKTTLATELYNRNCSSMSRSSFISNVRDAASTNTLHNLQENLLRDLHIQHSAFHNIYQGKGILARDFTSMTALIVLDDVDDVDQMDALLPPKRNLGRGSLVIVTTRDVDVLTSWGISSIYPMKLLDPSNAKQLFCRHAFSHPYSQPGSEHLLENYHKFEVLIERFVEACSGLPLSLKVFGAMVKGKPKAWWESQLLRISRILPNKIGQCLKVSYDALDQEVQQMFLDIACFFIGEQKSLLVAIWDGSGWSGEIGLEILINKCLIEIDEEGNIHMHDHLRDLGREIARKVSPSRIWKEEHISIQGGTTQIRGIVVAFSRQQFRVTHYPSPLEHCMEKITKRPCLPALQLLAVRGNDLREEFAALSRDLVWLRWCDFNGTNLPSWLSLTNLTVLELHNAKNLEELWQDNVEPPLQLRELLIDLAWKTCFQALPRSIGELGHLKKIVLNGSGNGMRTLPEEFCHLRSLEILQLSDFALLSSLPDQFGELINLRLLVLSGVPLTALPDSFKQLRLLQFLDISNSQSFFFTSEMLHVLEFVTELQILRISYCPQLVELPHLTTQLLLRELDLRYTGLRELPNNMSQLTNLETLVIASDNLTNLPRSLGDLSSLTSLAIYDCDLLKSLPPVIVLLSNLRSLKIEDTPIVDLRIVRSPIPGCHLKSLKCLSLFNTGVRAIAFPDFWCPSLETLRLSCNIHLTLIHILPRNVREIIVHGCEKMEDMRGIVYPLNLENLVVTDCPKLEVLPIPTYMHSLGRKITVRGCPRLVIHEFVYKIKHVK